MTRVVHCKKETFDVYIGRPSKWGNPFEIGKDGTREEVIEKYKAWILEQPDLLRVVVPELKDKTLGCWCYPKPCHGDVLARLADLPTIKEMSGLVKDIYEGKTLKEYLDDIEEDF